MKASNTLFIYGIRPILEKLKSGEEIEKVYIQVHLKGNLIQTLQAELREKKIPFSFVPIARLNRITKKNHQGVVAVVSPVKYYPLDQIVMQVFEKGETPLFLMLDGITDVRNFGSIARTAESMGVHAIIIPTKGNAQINADSIKSSAGALEHLPICRTYPLQSACNYLKKSGITLLGCTEVGKTDIKNSDLGVPLCIILGSEDTGISTSLLQYCDDTLRINQKGKILSLNVGIAAAIVLYECNRQRHSG